MTANQFSNVTQVAAPTFDTNYSRILLKPLHKLIKDELRSTLDAPNFQTAARQCSDVFLRKTAETGFAQDLTQFSNIALHLMVLYFHGKKTSPDASPGATLSALQTYAQSSKFASPRHVNTAVSRLVDLGRLARTLSPFDMRVHRLVPTSQMMARSREFTLTFVEPLVHLGVPEAHIQQFRTCDRTLESCLYNFGALWWDGCNPISPFSPMRYLTLKLRGLPVVCTLIQRSKSTHGLTGSDTTVGFTLSELSERYRVSRQHVRKVLEGLERMGLVSLNLQAQEITIKPDLILADECMVASAFIMFRHALSEAIGEVHDKVA